ncbi:MAG: DUF948 domain-containing protein [Ilumatobacteraceae bacterium]
MSAGDLAVLLAAVLCCIGFAALVVVLTRVLDTLRSLRAEIITLRAETRPLLRDLHATTRQARDAVQEARHDLDRFDILLGSAEAISDAVAGGGRVARVALSAPVIKTAALATGTRRAWRRFLRKDRGARSGSVLPARSASAAPARTTDDDIAAAEFDETVDGLDDGQWSA